LQFLIGTRALVERRILLCTLGVGAFIVTLAFSSWHDGLWHPDAPATPAALQHHQDSLVATGTVAAQPFAPSSEAVTTPIAAALPAAAAMSPPPAPAAPEPVQSEPQSEPDSNPEVDDNAVRARRDRGAEHGSRSR